MRSTIFISKIFVDPTEGAPDSGIEMIFDSIVSPMIFDMELPIVE